MHLLLAFHLATPPVDRTKSAESAEMLLEQRIRDGDREAAARAEQRRRQFERRFNRLVDAVAVFAAKYNQGKGRVWPHREAERLRKAMRDLQAMASRDGF
jgi:hypothetical protein